MHSSRRLCPGLFGLHGTWERLIAGPTSECDWQLVGTRVRQIKAPLINITYHLSVSLAEHWCYTTNEKILYLIIYFDHNLLEIESL